MTLDIDTRMRQASQSLRQASGKLTVPATTPRDPRRPVLAAAVVVIVALGAAAAFVVLQGGDQQADITTDPSGVPRMVPDRVPEGLRPTGAIDLPASEQELAGLGTMRVTVYGEPDAPDPFADSDLALLVYENGELTPDEPTITIRGRPGVAQDDPPYGAMLTWEEEPGLQVQLASRTLSTDELLAVADRLTVEDRIVSVGSLPSGLPGSLDPIASADMTLGTPLPLPMSGRGHIVGYQDGTIDRGAMVATVAGGPSDLAVMRWMAGADSGTEVQGHRGWAGGYEVDTASADVGSSDAAAPAEETTGPGVSIYTLMWEEAPGVLVAVQGFGLTEDEVRTIAESLRAVTDEEWEALVALVDAGEDAASEGMEATASETGATIPGDGDGTGASSGSVATGGSASLVPDDAEVVLRGEYAEGPWAVFLAADGSLCAASETDTSGSETCSEGAPRAATLHDSAGNPLLVYGLYPDGAVGHTFTSETGDAGPTTGPSQTTEAADGRSFYAVVVFGGPLPSEVGFVGTDGQVFETAFVDS